MASVQLWVVLTTLLLVLRFLLDFFGSWHANLFMLNVVIAIEMLNLSLVHYTLGMMLLLSEDDDYFHVWAVLLVTLQYSVKIGHPYRWSKQIPLLDLMSSLGAANLLQMQTSLLLSLRITLWLIWALNAARIIYHYSADDKADAINQENTRLVSDYMSYEHRVGKPELFADVANPDKNFTMEWYKYLVLGEDLAHKRVQDEGTRNMIWLNPDRHEGLITVDKIWNVDAGGSGLLGSAAGPANELKDVCLSFALYKLLRRLFYNLPIHEARVPRREKMKRLVFEYITENHERAFRAAAVELSFLHDLFYSKHAAMFADGFPTMSVLLSLLLVAATGYIAYPIRHIHADPKGITHGVLTTRIIVAFIVVKELAEIYMYVFSQWTKVLILCSYARRRCSLHPVVEAATRKVLFFMTRGKWDQRIRQHNLLISSRAVKVAMTRGRMNRLFFLPIKFPASIKLEECTKEAILMSFKKLKTDPRRLGSYFPIAFRPNKAFQDLKWAVELEADTHRILVWHIATSLCEIDLSSDKAAALKTIRLGPRPFVEKPRGIPEAEVPAWWEHYITAASLSNYCAYLVSRALVPDNGLVAKKVFYEVVREINVVTLDARIKASLFRLRSMRDMYDGLMKTVQMSKATSERDQFDIDNSLARKGAYLGKQLLDAYKEDKAGLWRDLSEFWTGFLLYLAVATRAPKHWKSLAGEQELLTHLWALLSHAGFLY